MDNASFLRAIVDTPDDDAVRLVYSDWLEEQGQADRAEFIRVQCALAPLAKFDPRRLPLLQREKELLAKHGDEWAKSVAAITTDYAFHRGFVDTVVLGARKLLTHGTKLFRVAPVQHVKLLRLGSSNVTVAELAGWSRLSRIRSLALQGSLHANEMRSLLTAPGLKKLTALTVDFMFPLLGIEPLLEGCLPHLEKLDLASEGSVLSTEHAEALAQARWASSLRHLNLKGHSINIGGVEAIAASERLKHLTTLVLHDCGAGLAGTQALLASSTLEHLEALDLRRSRLTDKAARAIAMSTKLPALKELYLGMNEIGPVGRRDLAQWRGLARLRSLHLYGNPLRDEGVRALAESPDVANLWRLDVTGTDISERGTRALAESPYLKNVRVGAFRGNEEDYRYLGPLRT